MWFQAEIEPMLASKLQSSCLSLLDVEVLSFWESCSLVDIEWATGDLNIGCCIVLSIVSTKLCEKKMLLQLVTRNVSSLAQGRTGSLLPP